MNWLTILRLLLSLAVKAAVIVQEQKLMEAGRAQALVKSLNYQIRQIDKAREARKKVRAILKANPDAIREEDENMRLD